MIIFRPKARPALTAPKENPTPVFTAAKNRLVSPFHWPTSRREPVSTKKIVKAPGGCHAWEGEGSGEWAEQGLWAQKQSLPPRLSPQQSPRKNKH